MAEVETKIEDNQKPTGVEKIWTSHVGDINLLVIVTELSESNSVCNHTSDNKIVKHRTWLVESTCSIFSPWRSLHDNIIRRIVSESKNNALGVILGMLDWQVTSLIICIFPCDIVQWVLLKISLNQANAWKITQIFVKIKSSRPRSGISREKMDSSTERKDSFSFVPFVIGK